MKKNIAFETLKRNIIKKTHRKSGTMERDTDEKKKHWNGKAL